MLFSFEFVQVDKKYAVFFNIICFGLLYILLLLYQVKRKQALLESNLSGIYLMTDEKVKRREFCFRTPLTFSEVFMPSKTHPKTLFFYSKPLT